MRRPKYTENLPYGFMEGAPTMEAKKGDYLCYALIGTHSTEGKVPVRFPDELSRGFWIKDPIWSGFMKDNGWIGWYGAICLMHHPIPVKTTRDKGMCLPHVWDKQLEIILKKMGFKVVKSL